MIVVSGKQPYINFVLSMMFQRLLHCQPPRDSVDEPLRLGESGALREYLQVEDWVYERSMPRK